MKPSDVVEILDPINTHTHPRDTDEEKDGRAELHIPLLAEAYAVAMCMGNTVPPLITSVRAKHKGDQWRKLVPASRRLQLLIGGLMTETTSAEDVIAGYDMPPGEAAWDYMKMFIRAASNAHGADVNDLSKMIHVLKAMTHTKFKHREHPMTLAVHLERKFDLFGRRIDIRKRERTSVERDLSYLFEQVPQAKIVVCHVTDAYTLEVIRYLRSKGFQIWGELAPHYSIWSCDDLFEAVDGGTKLNTHLFCLPVFKSDEDRRSNLAAMLSGEPCWIHGCDDACWPDDTSKEGGVKIDQNGFVTGGQTQIPAANVSWVIEQFAEAGKLVFLNDYMSLNARKAYGLEEYPDHYFYFKKEGWVVPATLERETPHGLIKARVAMGGATRLYKPL